MKEQLEQRLQQLKQEFESGQQMLAELAQRQQTLEETLLRISGAMQVIEEELTKATAESINEVPTSNGAEERAVVDSSVMT